MIYCQICTIHLDEIFCLRSAGIMLVPHTALPGGHRDCKKDSCIGGWWCNIRQCNCIRLAYNMLLQTGKDAG